MDSRDLPIRGTHWPGGEVPAHIRFLRGFVEGNYFYVFSALLMMLGSYLLMSSGAEAGPAFDRTLRSLLILQGYEALIIVTAGLIVLRFKRLGDAFTLLAIELALLLDPTFFANAFTTLPNTEATPVNVLWVNAGCFVFLIAKLGILLHMLHIRISPRALLGFVAAGVFVYFGEAPLNRPVGAASRETYYYILAWVPLALAALFPSVGAVARIRNNGDRFATPRQAIWLPRLIFALPLLIVISHFIESASVYGIRFYWTYGAPLLLVLALVTSKHWKSSEAAAGAFVIDLLGGLALLMSWPVVGVQGKAAIHGAGVPPPQFLEGLLPVLLVAGALAGLYVYYAWKHRYPAALLRLAVLAGGGAVYGLWSLGVFESAGAAMAGAASAVARFFGANLWIPAGAAWLGLLGLALRLRGFGPWFLFGMYSIACMGWPLPGPWGRWIPEMLQAAIVLALALSHVYGGGEDRPERTVGAVVLVLIGGIHFFSETTFLNGAVAAAEAAGFVIAGLMLRYHAYAVIGIIHALVLSVWLGRDLPGRIPPAGGALAAGLALFAIGVWVTFRKERLLGWLARWAEASGPRRGGPSGSGRTGAPPPSGGGEGGPCGGAGGEGGWDGEGEAPRG